MANEHWSREEVEAAVAEYRDMLIQELSGQSYSKAEHNRRLQSLIGRSKGSIERKHQNITAILRAMSCPYYIDGYKPLGNYQALLHDVVVEVLIDDPVFEQAAFHATNRPAVAPLGVDFDYWVDAPPRPSEVRDPRMPAFHPMQRDYVATEARNRTLGAAGEELVLAFERARLERAGKGDLAGRVEHVSARRGDGAGFDILSFEHDSRERFIEVKTTAFSKATPFFISQNELEFSEHQAGQFHLYRLFEFRTAPRMFALQGNMRSRLKLDPVNFLARVG